MIAASDGGYFGHPADAGQIPHADEAAILPVFPVRRHSIGADGRISALVLFEPGPSGSDPASLEAYRKLGRAINLGLLWAYHLMYLIIGGFWLVWRRGLRRTDNNYTLYVYDGWGFALLVMPLIALVCMAVVPFRMNADAQQAVMTLLWLAEQLMFFVGLAMTGFFLNSQDWKILSVIFLAAYIISLVWVSASDQDGDLEAFTLLSHWFSVEMVWAMICPAISLGLGGWLLYQNKKKIRPETGDSVPGGVATMTGTGMAAGFAQSKNGSEPPAGEAAQSGTGSQPPATERKEDRE